MPAHSLPVAISYALAALLLAAYGVEVCPYIEGIGHVGVLPAMAIGFVSAFCLRIVVYRFVARSTGAVLGIEMFCWLVAGAGLTAYDTFVLGFPVGSGLTVMVGFLAIGLSTSTYVALLTERDLILEGQADPQRSGPLGRASSISTRLYWFVLASQVLLAVVLMALISKDFAYLVEAIAVGLEPSFRDIALEIGASFVVLLIINAIVARRYAGNLNLVLQGQLAGMDAVAGGHFDQVVPVVSNDELARIGERTNEMIDALRDREQIKSAFGKLVSPQVAEAILGEEGGADLGGREVEAVVLFTDLRNFTGLSEGMEPQSVVAFLNEYFTMIVAAVHQEGGVVDKFIGDAAMAVFGIEGGQGTQDAGDRALRAALAMREGLQPVNARLAERGLPQVDSGIGLHYGPMVAGNIGSEDRLEYTVIGDAVNTASRLESLCKEVDNPLLLSQACHTRLSSGLQDKLVSLGEFSVKGKTEAVTVYGIADGA